MAKITIEIDTHDELDDRDNALLAVLGQHTQWRKPELPTQPAIAPVAPIHAAADAQLKAAGPQQAPEPARRGRKAANPPQPAPTAALFGTPARESEETEAPSAGTNGAGVTLPMINALLVQLLAPGSGHTAEELTEIVKDVTGGEAISPKHCDPGHWPEIHARFTALAAAG